MMYYVLPGSWTKMPINDTELQPIATAEDEPEQVRYRQYTLFKKQLFLTEKEADLYIISQRPQPRAPQQKWYFELMKVGERREISADHRRAAQNASYAFAQRAKKAGRPVRKFVVMEIDGKWWLERVA